MKSDKYLMVRSWRSDRTLIIATVLALSVEIVWLLMHLQIIPNPFKTQSLKMEQKPAGFVVKSQQELRKRGHNSLVWENASPDETLFYYDSVLTLSQSSATLHLNEQTEVHLSENTLVTIEPQSEETDNQIRLKFTRGDLRARNPYASTKIETKEWSLNLNQGSEVSLRQTGLDDYEVEVLKGHLEFEKDSGRQSLAENQVLKIEDNKVGETLAIEENLKFAGLVHERVYSFQPVARIPVQWQGEAEAIEVLPLGKDKFIKSVDTAQSAADLDLATGKYTLRLTKNGKVSEAKEIEVWQAPTVHLLSPFPRDRVRTNENISFIWSYLPEAKEYKFVVVDLKSGKTFEKRVSENAFLFEFEDEGDAQWKVIAIDSDGFEMPASYANQIFPQHDPLAAPKLKMPSLRVPTSVPASNPGETPAVEKAPESKQDSQPGVDSKSDEKEALPSESKSDQSRMKKSGSGSKKKTSSLPVRLPTLGWILKQFVLTEAIAAEKKPSSDYEAVFAWEPVAGADLYTIEISNSPDFRSPQLSKVTKKTEFIWTRFSLGTYYWRVAAGTSGGRLGVFSEPAKVQLDKMPENSGNRDGVLVRKKAEAVPEKVAPKKGPVPTEEDEIFANAPKPVFDEKRFEQPVKLPSDETRVLKESYLFEWTPLVTNWNLNGEDQLKALLNGSTSGAGHFQTEQMISPEASYFVDAFYAQYKWEASDTTQYPFQEVQTMTDTRVQVLFGTNRTKLRRGGIVQTVPYIQRKGLEQIEIHNALTIGPSVYYTWKDSERWKSGHTLSFMAGSALFAFSTQNSFRYLYYKGDSSSLSLGLRFQADLVFYERSFSNGWSGGLILGFEN